MDVKDYQVFNEGGEVIDVIVATEEFMRQKYPNGSYVERHLPKPDFSRIISKREFRFRFTTAEYTALLSAAKTDAEVQAWVETFNLYNEIHLDDPYVIESVGMMADKNIIDASRKETILSTNGVPTDTP